MLIFYTVYWFKILHGVALSWRLKMRKIQMPLLWIFCSKTVRKNAFLTFSPYKSTEKHWVSANIQKFHSNNQPIYPFPGQGQHVKRQTGWLWPVASPFWVNIKLCNPQMQRHISLHQPPPEWHPLHLELFTRWEWVARRHSVLIMNVPGMWSLMRCKIFSQWAVIQTSYKTVHSMCAGEHNVSESDKDIAMFTL